MFREKVGINFGCTQNKKQDERNIYIAKSPVLSKQHDISMDIKS